jgi:hypothetical protein
LRQAIQEGVAALERRHRNLLADGLRSDARESLNLDDWARWECPESNRWDYLVAFASQPGLVAIEPHTAADHEVVVVVRKKKWALQYLRSHLREGASVTIWCWVASGRTGFSRTGNWRRRLDSAGIRFAGRQLRDLKP